MGVAGIGEIEGGVNNAEGLGLYGGADDNDNSGILGMYVVSMPAMLFCLIKSSMVLRLRRWARYNARTYPGELCC